MTLKNVSSVLLSFLLTATYFANAADSVEEAANLYALRAEVRSGPETSFALEAAQMYERLGQVANTTQAMAELGIRQSEALYWVGTHSTNTNESIAVHKKAYEVAQSLFSLEGSISSETLAQAYYFYGANLGKWGEPQSSVVKAQNWPKLKAAMQKILDLKQDAVEDYGVHRILGRAYYKLPWPLGSNSDSLSELRMAFEPTRAVVNGVKQKFSRHGTNNVFLAETLIAIGGDDELDEAEEILRGFIAADQSTLYPERRPENEEEVLNAKNLLESL